MKRISRLTATFILRQALGSSGSVWQRPRTGTVRQFAAVADTHLSSRDQFDVVIVGSGAAGLVAALRAYELGLNPLVVEKGERVGGASAYSGGGLWIPNNHINQAHGVPDSLQNALKYMEQVIGDVGPASTRARKLAFLTEGPKMVKFLSDLGFQWVHGRNYADYYPEVPGGSVQARCIEGKVFNSKKLGDWRQHILTRPGIPDVPMYTSEAPSLAVMLRSPKALMSVISIGFRMVSRLMLGQRPVTLGKSLIAQLLFIIKARGIQVWRQTPLIDLITTGERVTGVILRREGQDVQITARKGVLLCAGGFARNKAMRDTYQQSPVSDEWTSVPPGDVGDAITVGQKIGAATALMDAAWWGPTLVDPATKKTMFMMWERSLPHGIIVDSSGKRFMNESASYVDAGYNMYVRHRTVSAVPAWLIIDSTHRKRYLLGTMAPGKVPRSALNSGFITQSSTIEELASRIGVNVDGLRSEIARFNDMAVAGIDDDFARGSSAYDRFYSDPSMKPNPNLGPVITPPFYAMKVYPGDLGTKGGLLTDEHARVLREDGRPINGLYAAGNTSASVMGRTYPGPGSTLGPACSFGYIAMNHVARSPATLSKA